MNKIQLIVENQFVTTSQNSIDLGISVFDRVFNKLIKKQGSLGKVQPIYIEVGGSLKLLGVVTLNVGGSYSFFPELPGHSDFDHFTFAREVEGHHHVTRVTNKGREKIFPIRAESLTNDIYHGVTFVINDYNLLKDAPKEVHYPEVDISEFRRIQNAFLTAGVQEGSTILKNTTNTGALCVQFFLIPQGISYKDKLLIFPKHIKTFTNINIEDRKISVFNAVIPHESQSAYSLGIGYYGINENIAHPFLISLSASREGFYTKIPIKRLKNMDSLNNKKM
jgi:hypothetical protein